jgi:hypothetical protein
MSEFLQEVRALAVLSAALFLVISSSVSAAAILAVWLSNWS